MGARRLRRWGAVLVAAALLAVPAPAQADGLVGQCPPGVGIGLVDAVRSPDERASAYVVDRVERGDVFTRRVRVCNGTTSEQEVELYAGAADVQDGSFRVREGTVHNELSRWIRVEPGRLRVPAGRAVTASATFTVPEDAADGERYAVLLAALPGTRGAPGVTVVERVGVRVYLAVGDVEATRTDFQLTSLQAVRLADGRPVLRAQVRNTGRRAIDPRGELSLSDGPGGTRAGPFPAAVGTTVAPGATGEVTVPLAPELADGPWRAELRLAAGGVERAAAATVRWPESGAAAPVPAESLEGHGGTVAVAVGLLVLALGVLLVLLLARRRSEEEEAPATGSGAALPGSGGAVPAAGAVLPPGPVPSPGPVLRPGPLPPAGSVPAVPPLPPLPALPAPRSAAVRRALAERAAAPAGVQGPGAS